MFGIFLKTKKNTANQTVYGVIFCDGDKRDRTADLLNAIQALSQVSYTPMAKEADSIAATLAAARIIIAKRRGRCQ